MKKLIFGIAIVVLTALTIYTTYSYIVPNPDISETGSWVSSTGFDWMPGTAKNVRTVSYPGARGYRFTCESFGVCYEIDGANLWIYGIEDNGEDENDPNSLPGSGYQNPPVEVEILTGP